MTIFDVMRYPIINAPTKEVMTSLPPDLFNKWRLSSEWGNPEYLSSAEDIGDWYDRNGHKLDADEGQDVALLKKMIAEWDNDEPI